MVITRVSFTLLFTDKAALGASTYPLPDSVRQQSLKLLDKITNANIDGLDWDLKFEIDARNRKHLSKVRDLLHPFSVALAFKTVFESTLLALHQANDLGENTVSIPLLGVKYPGALSSGENLTEAQSTAAILSALKRFSQLRPNTFIKQVRVVAFGQHASTDAWLRGTLYGLFMEGKFADIAARLTPELPANEWTWEFLRKDFLQNDRKHTKISVSPSLLSLCGWLIAG